MTAAVRFCWLPEFHGSIPEGARVRIHQVSDASEGAATTSSDGTVAPDYAPNGMDASKEYRAAGVADPKDLPDRVAVVVLDAAAAAEDGTINAKQVPYEKLEILNPEFYAFVQRAQQNDAKAARVLGHCLMEGQGGLAHDVAEGGYWTSFAGAIGDPYSVAMTDYFQGQGPAPVVPPAFDTMADAEQWPTWDAATMSAADTEAKASASAEPVYVPPKVWTYEGETTGTTWTINRPTAGPRFDRELPVGDRPLQLYSLGTPNGQKVTIMLEELLEAGCDPAEIEYDAWYVDIGKGDQFGSGFTDINPNSKIPALVVKNDPACRHAAGDDGSSSDPPLHVFESGSILLYLADRFKMFIPSQNDDPAQRVETLNWLFWQMGSPYLGGGFGHFYQYADEKQKYPIDRFTMEVKRQLDVLDKQLAKTGKYLVGDELTIADLACFPWYGNLVLGRTYGDAAEFLSVNEYPHVLRWARDIDQRPAVQRGRRVNRNPTSSVPDGLRERHGPRDFLDDNKKSDDKEKGEEQSNVASNKKQRTD